MLDDSTLNRDTSRRDSTIGRALRWLRPRSRVVQLIDRTRKTLEERRLSSRKAAAPFSVPNRQVQLQPADEGLADAIYYEPVDPVWQEAWRVTEGTIKLMRDEVKSRGAQFFVVTLTNPLQVSPDARKTQRLLEIAELKNFFYPDFRIKALGDREGFPVLNLAPPFQKYAEQNHVYLFTHHWNQAGHRLAGELISDWLCNEMLGNGRSLLKISNPSFITLPGGIIQLD